MENQNYSQPPQDLSKSDQTNKQKYSEGLINLKDYFNFIYRKKISIIAIFLIFVMAGVIITLNKPKTFESRALLVIGQVRGKKIESVHELKAIFSSSATLKELINKLNLSSETSPEAVVSKFNIKSGRDTEFAEVRGRGETPERALEMGSLVVEMIIERHQGISAQAQAALEEGVKQIEGQIKKALVMLKASQERLEDFRVEGQMMQEDIEELIKNGSFVSEGRGLVIQAYIGSWQDSRDRLRDEEVKIKELEMQKEKLEESLREKKLQRVYDDYFTRVEVPFVLPESKIEPNNRQNVKIAGFLGLLVGILYAFAAEYISKWKSIDN